MRTSTKTLAALLIAIACSTAMAHTGAEGHGHTGFMAGFLHPFNGIDHLATMVAVGIWSALVARRLGPEMLWGPLGFANLLLVGAALGLQGVDMPAVEPLVAASLVATGLLVVSQLKLQGVWAGTLVGLFAVFHGFAHGYELADSASAFQTLAGMLCATVVLHTGGLALGWSLRGANVWVPRAIGASVAILGSVLLLHVS